MVLARAWHATLVAAVMCGAGGCGKTSNPNAIGGSDASLDGSSGSIPSFTYVPCKASFGPTSLDALSDGFARVAVAAVSTSTYTLSVGTSSGGVPQVRGFTHAGEASLEAVSLPATTGSIASFSRHYFCAANTTLVAGYVRVTDAPSDKFRSVVLTGVDETAALRFQLRGAASPDADGLTLRDVRCLDAGGSALWSEKSVSTTGAVRLRAATFDVVALTLGEPEDITEIGDTLVDAAVALADKRAVAWISRASATGRGKVMLRPEGSDAIAVAVDRRVGDTVTASRISATSTLVAWTEVEATFGQSRVHVRSVADDGTLGAETIATVGSETGSLPKLAPLASAVALVYVGGTPAQAGIRVAIVSVSGQIVIPAETVVTVNPTAIRSLETAAVPAFATLSVGYTVTSPTETSGQVVGARCVD